MDSQSFENSPLGSVFNHNKIGSNFGQDSFHLRLWKKLKHLHIFIVSLHSAFILSTDAQGSSF